MLIYIQEKEKLKLKNKLKEYILIGKNTYKNIVRFMMNIYLKIFIKLPNTNFY